jgi:hypothetical protein
MMQKLFRYLTGTLQKKSLSEVTARGRGMTSREAEKGATCGAILKTTWMGPCQVGT